jgi:tetratricopeptide (TPR) repeat protein
VPYPPEVQDLWDRAIALYAQGRYRDSLSCFRSLEAALPDHPKLLSNLGQVYRDAGDLGQAEQYFRRLCELQPEDAAAHFNLAITLLRAGRLREGFAEYEWRWQVAQFAPQRREFSCALWRGEPLEGRRILLWGEQGAGDTIQFVRYASMVRAAGGEVILEVLPHLERLMSWLEGEYRVVNALSTGVEFDLHCPLMSLPQRFGTELESIPTPAAFAIPRATRTKWAERFRTGKKNIGLVWATNPGYLNNAARSIPAEYFLPLTGLSGIQCWGLQVGAAAADTPEGVTSLGQELIDFGDTAAAISELDLVITVDTAVAHLAGSLGKPARLLLSSASDWRWMMDRGDSPWYPTMTILRQKTSGEWGEVVDLAIRQLHPVLSN